MPVGNGFIVFHRHSGRPPSPVLEGSAMVRLPPCPGLRRVLLVVFNPGKINAVWRQVAQSLMKAPAVVLLEPPSDASSRLRSRGIGVKVNVLIFQAAPKSLHEDVVEKPTSTIHADPNSMRF